ncbi:hypothetical protein D3218_17580 [Aureimonas flava]|uniref:Hydantoin racemase n=1 Tax=Aureimonas flava TaxID=2320271 RepID=A0A3A1WN92_9HYPH|nr:aspartate/glutamate racemase family protein [Aureimonas flava]RIX98192.1 hypothetical protein D3218_17580 [Aureimonas flava]
MLNPNTSDAVTKGLAVAAGRLCEGWAEVRGHTAVAGAPALETVEHLRSARSEVVRLGRRTSADAFVVGAFGDPGLADLRRISSVPCVGIGEAGYRAASQAGAFSILTLGKDLRETILGRVASLGFRSQLIDIRFLDAGVLDVASDPVRFVDALLAEADLAKREGAACLLLGGAPFSGLSSRLSERSAVPVLDGLTSAIADLRVRLLPGALPHDGSPEG